MNNIKVKGTLGYRKIISLYKKGMSPDSIGLLNGTSFLPIIRVLDLCGVKRRSLSEAKRKYKFNERFFEIINTERKAYWLGFVHADGWVNKTRAGTWCFGITLGEKDKSHLELFKKHLGRKAPLYRKLMLPQYFGGGNTYYKLDISSKKFVGDLISHNCTERKSMTLKFPITVPDSLIHHFIRGYFDGDGSIYVNSTDGVPCVKIISTKEFLDSLLKVLNLGTTKGIYRKRNNGKNTFTLDMRRHIRVKKIHDFMYKDATVFMKRKKVVFDRYFKSKEYLRITQTPYKRVKK